MCLSGGNREDHGNNRVFPNLNLKMKIPVMRIYPNFSNPCLGSILSINFLTWLFTHYKKYSL